VCVCTVTDFSANDKASSIKFCKVVLRSLRQGISHFGEFCSPEAQNLLVNRPVCGHAHHCNISREARSACVDIGQFPLSTCLLMFYPKFTQATDACMMNAEQRIADNDPQKKTTDLGSESTCRLLLFTTTIAIYYCYSAIKFQPLTDQFMRSCTLAN